MQDGSTRAIAVVAAIIIGLVAFFALLGSFETIGSQEIGILTRFGKVEAVWGPGAHWKTPFTESVSTMDTQEQKLAVDDQVYSKDSQTVSTHLVVNYQLKVTEAEQVFKEVRNNYRQVYIDPVLSPAVEEVFSQFTANDLVVKRPELPALVRDAITKRVQARGVTVKGVEFTFSFDDAYENAIRQKQVKEQEALTAVNQTKIEAEKKAQAILASEALAEKTRLEAVALQSAQGEKFIEKLRVEVQQKSAEALLEFAKHWTGAVPQTVVFGGGSEGPGIGGLLQTLNLNK